MCVIDRQTEDEREVLCNKCHVVNKIKSVQSILFQLLIQPTFQDVEKIKTIGSTYMAATGLQSGHARQQVGQET